MARTTFHSRAGSLALTATFVLLGACADAPLAVPDATPTRIHARFSAVGVSQGDAARAIAALTRSTARYHDLDAAIEDGFVFLHACENRPDEGPVGIVYVHMDRLVDGVIDPDRPEALIYEPREGGDPRLVGVELAIPVPLWPSSEPPSFLGNTFQPEEEFGVWGLHVWIWSDNPNGMFAESNPRVSCGE